MPSDVVTIVVSTGIGVSVIAGVLSGVCYILTHGFTRKRSRKPVLQWHCFVCGNYLRSYYGNNIRAVICLECEERVCKLRCSKREYMRKGWICYSCLKQPTLFQGILNAVHLRYKEIKELASINNTNQTDQMEQNTEPGEKPEKDHIRDFIEKLVSTILGENVDDASVLRIYSDKYFVHPNLLQLSDDALFEKYHTDLRNAITDLTSTLHISVNNTPLAEQSPGAAHTTLKQIIESLLQEAVVLPTFNRAVESQTSSGENKQTYEELLATAILNKVVSKSQRSLASSSPASISSRISPPPQEKENKEYFFGQETLDSKWNPTDLETTSNSSLNEYLQSDSSSNSSSINYVDHVSLTIRQRIEDVTSTNVDDEIQDDVHYFRENTSLLDNSDANWYLKKRELHGSPVPVPMLVPNPTTTAKVLIGDKEIDETSDLSDAISECDDMESVEVQNYRIKTKMIIGGHNPVRRIRTDNFSDEETSVDSGVKEDRDDVSEKLKPFNVKPKTDITVDDENVEDVSLTSLNSNIENDLEYLEKYASLPRTILKSPSPSQRFLKSLPQQYIAVEANETSLNITNQQTSEEKLENSPAVEGSYSKKEKEKWNYPVMMKHNPYTRENIEKRIQLNQRFGRDYYTRQASAPSGKKKKDEDEESFWTPPEEEIYKATPATVDTETKPSMDGFHISEITSTFDTNLVTCNGPKQFEAYDHSYDDRKELRVTVNTKGLLYIPEEMAEYSPDPQQTVHVEETEFNESAILKFETNGDNKEENNNFYSMKNNNENVEVQNIPKIKPRTFTTQIKNSYFEKNIDSRTIENSEKPVAMVSNKKSDNTLIKKIYSDPVVRSFALTNRERIPVVLDSSIKNLGNASPTIKHDESTSGEPLLKTTISIDTSDNFENMDRAYTSEELNSKTNNDTFSLEFSDNDSSQREQSSDKEQDLNELKQKRIVAGRLGQFSKSFPNLSKINIPNENYKRTEYESRKNVTPATSQEKLPGEIFISVRNLKKLFENNTSSYNKDKPVHSLTARSLSKQMKEKLKSNSIDE